MRMIWSFLICMVIALPLSAQDKSQRYEQIESLKVAYITQKLDLSTSEAEKFWPVYNNYQQELRVIYKQRREARAKQKADPNNKLDNELDFESRILNIRKKYKDEFSKVLPPDKVLSYFNAEREFREQMIKELKDRRDQ
ncbi:hypothetical protein GZH53_05530 [Flavihumibacter sp. R14]|nr:hypothetical protein [Flavihumibacter soli]